MKKTRAECIEIMRHVCPPEPLHAWPQAVLDRAITDDLVCGDAEEDQRQAALAMVRALEAVYAADFSARIEGE